MVDKCYSQLNVCGRDLLIINQMLRDGAFGDMITIKYNYCASYQEE